MATVDEAGARVADTAGDEASTVSAARDDRRRPRRLQGLRRHRRLIGLVALAGGSFLGGLAAGWQVQTTPDEPPVEALNVTVRREITAADRTSDIAVAVPNVYGLDETTARQVLLDAGASPDRIDVTAVPAAGTPGLVVTLDPPPGVPAVDGVMLGISEPATMPDLRGQDISSARSTLGSLGARVRVTRRFDPDHQEATVLDQDPAPSESVPHEVSLVVASPPSSIYLSALRALEGQCQRSDARVDGIAHPESLRCAAREGRSVRPAVYLLDRSVTRLEATVGYDDTSDPGSVMRYAVVADGTTLAEGTVAYGESAPVGVDVTGVLRVELHAELLHRAEGSRTPNLVFGSATLIGGPDQIDELERRG